MLSMHKKLSTEWLKLIAAIDSDEETKDEVTLTVQEEEPVVLNIKRFGLPEVT